MDRGMTPWWSPRSVAANRPAFMGVDGYVPPETAGIPGMAPAPPPPMPTANVPPEAQGALSPMQDMAEVSAYDPSMQGAPAPPPVEAPSDFGSGGGWFSGDAPRYADGSVHQAWGGPPRTSPGGGGGGGGAAQQVTVPSTGASAGPNGVRPPRSEGLNVSAPSGQSSGGGGGGGGGGDLYNALKSKLTGNLFGTGAAAEEEGPTQAQYRRSQRNSTQDWRAYEQEQKRRGAINAYDPLTPLYDLNGGTPLSAGQMDFWGRMPMRELALLSLGANNDNRYLNRASGTKKYQQDLAGLYANLLGGGFDRQELQSNIFNSGKNTFLGQAFMDRETPESRYDKNNMYQGMRGANSWNYAPASQQVDTFVNLMGATEGIGRSAEHQSTVEGALRRMLMGFQSQQGIRNPEKNKSLTNWFAKNRPLG